MSLARKMHLCFVGNMLGRHPGYITTQGQILADLFAAEGYRVTCVSPHINRIFRLLHIMATLIATAHSLDVVVIDTYSGPSFAIADVASFICRRLNVPVIMVLRGGNFPAFINKHPRWTTRVLKNADVLLAPSEFLAKEVGDRGFEIRVVTNVVDLEKYPFKERSSISPKLVWMRSFHDLYNPEMAVQVLAELRQSEPNATLVMAGADKGLRNKVEQIVREMDLTNAVSFAGFLDHEKKVARFSDADIYINTNRIDNMPVSVVEARALGLPVVATNVGGIPYLIHHNEDGMLVPDGDVGSMVESIKALLNDQNLTRMISRNGRRSAEESDWRTVRELWNSLFEEVLNPARKKSPNAEVLDEIC